MGERDLGQELSDLCGQALHGEVLGARLRGDHPAQAVLVDDQEAKAAIVQRVRDAFAAVADARQTDKDGRKANPPEQKAAMRERLPMLSNKALTLLVRLSDDELNDVAAEAL
ncbi:MAG: hypothetical protein KY450_13860, partial [Actinobacteria bacterium]|nr:hypothetical protein [Actinomycetota bacterium]